MAIDIRSRMNVLRVIINEHKPYQIHKVKLSYSEGKEAIGLTVTGVYCIQDIVNSGKRCGEIEAAFDKAVEKACRELEKEFPDKRVFESVVYEDEKDY